MNKLIGLGYGAAVFDAYCQPPFSQKWNQVSQLPRQFANVYKFNPELVTYAFDSLFFALGYRTFVSVPQSIASYNQHAANQQPAPAAKTYDQLSSVSTQYPPYDSSRQSEDVKRKEQAEEERNKAIAEQKQRDASSSNNYTQPVKFHEVLKKIVEKYGKPVLAEPRFTGLIADLGGYDGCPAMRKVMKAVVKQGYSQKIYATYTKPFYSNVNVDIADSVSQLAAAQNFKYELVSYAFDSLLFSLGKMSSVSVPQSARGWRPFRLLRPTAATCARCPKQKAIRSRCATRRSRLSTHHG